jgi:pepF/M3 family oligoendopeptidase
MTTTATFPHWDLTVFYPGLDSPEFESDFASIGPKIEELRSILDRYDIGPREGVEIDDRVIEAFETALSASEALARELHTLLAYVRSFVSTDSLNDLAQAQQSELQQQSVPLYQLDTRFTAWVGSLDVEQLIARSEIAAACAYALRKDKRQAEHLMPLSEEALALELALSGGIAWGKLHSNVSAQLLVPIEIAGQREAVPMSVVRNMAHDADRAVRRRAYEAEIETWKSMATPLAAALNSIKGESNTLTRRRGWDSVLDYALFLTNIDRETLDAMLGAARASFPDFRRYLRAKARALGQSALAWYDLFAPIGVHSRVWQYEQGRAFLCEQFGTYSERLRSFAERAFEEDWIDAEPRPGKVGGAFCMWIKDEQSRVLTNYMPTYDGVSTLAHELGHAYHNFNLASRSMTQRQTPMTLAETASIFCETIVEHAALDGGDRQEQLAILEASIQGACQVVVDITSRFLFESAVFERRRQRELSVEELNALMLDAQGHTYGDGLDESVLHPYMWAAKTHYYSTGRPFYNFPYMFGLLFGLGLYARYQQDPAGFRAQYDDLLSSTGLADAATLAARFGIDIRSGTFWTDSLNIVRGNIDRFERLVLEEADLP